MARKLDSEPLNRILVEASKTQADVGRERLRGAISSRARALPSGRRASAGWAGGLSSPEADHQLLES